MNLVVEILNTILVVLYSCLESLALALLPLNFRRKKSVAGEIALVTGAGSGIGRLISLRLAELGAKVILWDINGHGIKATKELIEQQGGVAYAYECDVTDRYLVYLTADRVRDEVGEVSILVNNAGIVSGKPLLETPDDKLQKTMDVNVTAHFWTLKAFLPAMISRGHGHIITISSIAGKVVASRLVDYCASKFGAVGLHEALAQELRGSGIRLTNICPFFINTGMFDGLKSRFPRILPGLDQQDVANRVVLAIQLNEREVVIPPVFNAMLALNALLPGRAKDALSDLLGVRNIMSTFTGREGVPVTVGPLEPRANFVLGKEKTKGA